MKISNPLELSCGFIMLPSVMIRGIDEWRKGHVRLSQLMVSEGRIPDSDLMFFMTVDEIKELLATRSPNIISKANHRRRYPVLDKYISPKISRGFPRPINTDSSSEKVNNVDSKMEGVPVSRGRAKGFIRVALNLEEPSHLKCGEILVAYCTDIGWSPYFPILAGVVTELGGLISHGTPKHVETVEDLQTRECLDPVPGCSSGSCSLGVNGFTSSIIEGTAKDVETVEDLQTKEVLDVMPGSSGSCLIDVNGIASSIIEAIKCKFKWLVSCVSKEMDVLRKQKRFDFYDVKAKNDPIRMGFLTPPGEQILESPSSEADLEGFDEMLFYGQNSESQYLVVRLVRGLNHEAEAWIYLQMGNGKIYNLKETSGFQLSGSDGRVFSCGGLQMRYLSPMRKWKISFKGLLRESDGDSSTEKMVYVKFDLLWLSSADPFDSLTDINTADLAHGFAGASWKSAMPPLKMLNKALNFYCQPGVTMGMVTIDEDEHEIYLYGERMRVLGDIFSRCGAEVLHLFGQTQQNGRRVNFFEVSVPYLVEKLRFGYIVHPSGDMDVISKIDVDVPRSLIHEYNLHVTCSTKNCRYVLKSTFKEKYRFHSKDGSAHFDISCIDFQMNSIDGRGIVFKGHVTKPRKEILPKNLCQAIPSDTTPMVLHFADKRCQDSSLTGGKGSSLGKLTELSKDFQNFIVPNGFVVTTVAYENFITNDILNNIKDLENVLYGNVSGDVKAACQKVADEVMKSTIPDGVRVVIEDDLQRAFPEKKIIKFAVRSSATGEDTDQLTATRQMENFLGVRDLEILTAVKKCWASQFSYIAVQYKRQYGQIINSPMAVVIQEMIPCDVAGVLFTCDPLTGNPTTIIMTANYGLGESVVSGTEEPDTIELKKGADEELTIKNKDIGSKRRRIVIKGNEGTTVEDVSDDDRHICCLTDEMALRLGYLAVKIEKSYRSQRDIEWGFWKNCLYIFQSRPVTSRMEISDYEIDHEMDYPLRSEDEYFTVCNIGEAMPGSMSTLGEELVRKFNNNVFQGKDFQDNPVAIRGNYYAGGMITMYNHRMMYCLDLLRDINVDLEATKLSTIALFGRIIDDKDLYKTAKERHSQMNPKYSLLTLFRMFYRVMLESKELLKKAQAHYANYILPIEEFETSQQLFNFLTLRCTDLHQAVKCHMECSEASIVFNLAVFSFLKKANGGVVDTKVYHQYSLLATTNADVESADVPPAIEKLASCISKDINPEQFKKMDIDQAVNYLEMSDTVSGHKYKEFLVKHGHRCLKETDIRSETWESNPKSLIKLLQSLVGSDDSDKDKKKSMGIFELLSTLSIPLNRIERPLLALAVRLLRTAVKNREASKSVVIRGIDAWRKGYVRLSQLMVSEGRIPDEDLMFFMTLDEIKELLATRSPNIISKANHRRRRYPVLDKYIFPEISRGFPRPINMDSTTIIVHKDVFKMEGVPVSRGIAKGFIRVALNVEEASHLKRGEILVTYCTDIGWSPYFPILAGVVTELGGLISHGAVISRECGIPCVVALHGATREFQTGDYAMIDGNKGFLQKLQKPEKTCSDIEHQKDN